MATHVLSATSHIGQPPKQAASVKDRTHRQYELVVWGATGFTGRLVCEHLAENYKGKVRWAMGGRSQSKLQDLRTRLKSESVDILVADANDAPALGHLAASTQVVLNLAGPFAELAPCLVEQCVSHATHYCDITAEVPWVRSNIERYHDTALAKATKIVHCCGYDSQPSGLGTLMLVDHARKELGRGLDKAYTLVRLDAVKGGFSGGTIASGLHMAEHAPRVLQAVLKDEYFLANFHTERNGSDTPPSLFPTYNKLAQSWTAPFIMEFCNGRVVHLSHALSSNTPLGGYGRDFKYSEMVLTGTGAFGYVLAWAVAVGYLALGGVAFLPMLRSIAKRFLPAPGQGPSEAAMRGGHWRHDLIGVTEGPQPRVLRGMCGDDKRDPGYWGTSRMILEAGLCLVKDGDAITAAGLPLGGVLTPATAMGMRLVHRLRAAGLTYSVSETSEMYCEAGQPTAAPASAATAKSIESGSAPSTADDGGGGDYQGTEPATPVKHAGKVTPGSAVGQAAQSLRERGLAKAETAAETLDGDRLGKV